MKWLIIIVSSLLILAGAFAKLQHWAIGQPLLAIGLLGEILTLGFFISRSHKS